MVIRQSVRWIYFVTVACLPLMSCGSKFPEKPWMNNDPLAWMGSGETDIPTSTMTGGQSGDLLAGTAPLEMHQGAPMGVFGLNIDEYFAEDLKDNAQRIARLENVVKAMHRDYAKLVPELQRLSGMHGKTHPMPVNPSVLKPENNLAAPDLEVPSQSSETPPAVIDTSVTEEGMKTTQADTTIESNIDKGPRPIYANQAMVSGVRIGEHPDRVRIVFDVTKDIKYQTDLDNAEKILVVDLPDTGWDIPALSESFGKMPVVKSYKVDSANQGKDHIFVIQLSGTTRILKEATLPALSGGGKRIMIDLAK